MRYSFRKPCGRLAVIAATRRRWKNQPGTIMIWLRRRSAALHSERRLLRPQCVERSEAKPKEETLKCTVVSIIREGRQPGPASSLALGEPWMSSSSTSTGRPLARACRPDHAASPRARRGEPRMSPGAPDGVAPVWRLRSDVGGRPRRRRVSVDLGEGAARRLGRRGGRERPPARPRVVPTSRRRASTDESRPRPALDRARAVRGRRWDSYHKDPDPRPSEAGLRRGGPDGYHFETTVSGRQSSVPRAPGGRCVAPAAEETSDVRADDPGGAPAADSGGVAAAVTQRE